MNLAYRDIRHHQGRFLLTCVGLALLLGVVMSMIGIYRGLVDEALVLARAPGADLWVVEPGTRGPFAEASRIPRDARNAVARLAGVTEAGIVTYQTMEIPHDGRRARLLVVGYEPGRLGGPVRIVNGRALAQSHFEMVADRRAGLPLGTRLRLGPDVFTVVGLTSGQVDTGGNAVVYMALRDAQKLQFTLEGAAARSQATRGEAVNPNQVNAVLARVAPGIEPANVAAVAARWKHLAAHTQAEQEAILLTSVVEKARRQIGLFTGILLLVSAVIVALIIFTMTMDKTREIATLKLIGAPNRTIVGLIVQQALVMGLIGFTAGTSLLMLAIDVFPRRVVLNPEDVLALGGIVVAVCLFGSMLGVRYALRIEAAQALGG